MHRHSESFPSGRRCWDRFNSVVFLKTKAAFGGLSNMAGGFPVCVNGQVVRTVEALYQACRFPHKPEVQRIIVEQKSPMTAKMKGKPHRSESREDWESVRVDIMRWCLRVKLIQHWDSFGELLTSTGELAIVEESRRDVFWGAKSDGERALVGENVLGRLLMELREQLGQDPSQLARRVEPPSIPTFLLDGHPIQAVGPAVEMCAQSREGPQHSAHIPEQRSLLD